ncbi:hypothetical protein [Acidimicrobium ferrooxidans]|uniref:hypothetical protein n=1 Tax=Acidimicrobium ferrooxidans TaxID=53635 RepID=UPI0001A2E4B5|nr:hypothetical protein [Acidimicrobium ferrooxidans]
MAQGVRAPVRALRVPIALAAIALIGGPVLGVVLGQRAHRQAYDATCPASVLHGSVIELSRTRTGDDLAVVSVENTSATSCSVGGFYLPVGAPLPNEIVRVGTSNHQILLASTSLRLGPRARAAFLVVGTDVPRAYDTARGVVTIANALPGSARVSVSPLFPASKLTAIVAAAKQEIPS